MLEIALAIAGELHRVDGQAAERMNFSAAKAYNRLVAAGEERAAEIVYRFGRALTDRSLFPEQDEKAAEDLVPAASEFDSM
ncbi:MAG: hypothetical protein K5872_02995 [Rhizobiaceae bacterium]|nr:hypothetical protein [Rhizobiaceae bacterium]MCV0405177.1 hypothetical protein [Rhizobiaceae bacterium]